MAEKYPLADGNWSNASNWNDSTKPVAGDSVHANGYTVTIDEDTADALALLTVQAGTTAVAGGGFLVTGTRTIHADRVEGGTTNTITYSGASGTTLTINAEVDGLYSGTVVAVGTIKITNDGTLVVNGDLVGFLSSAYNRIISIEADGPTVTVNGNVVTSTSTFYGYAIYTGYGCTINVTGTVDTNQRYHYGIYVNTGSNVYITVTGDVQCTYGRNNGAIFLAAAGGGTTVTVTGDVIGTANYGQGYPIYSISGITINVTGSVIANLGFYCIYAAGGGIVNVTGNVYGSAAYYAISANNSGEVDITGNVYGHTYAPIYTVMNTYITGTVDGTYGTVVLSTNSAAVAYINGSVIAGVVGFPLVLPRFFIENAGAVTWTFKKWDKSTNYVMYSAEALAGVPTVGNVRRGVTFGPSNELTGTLDVPAKDQVLSGVPVDDGVGTIPHHVSLYRAGR